MDHTQVIFVPYSQDILEQSAREILADVARNPDATPPVILTPDVHSHTALRQHLIQQAQSRALIGLSIYTLRDWLDSLYHPELPPIENNGRELLLYEALQGHRELFGKTDLWQLCSSLLALFDEFTQYNCTIPPALTDFVSAIKKGYRLEERELAPLGQEAKLVHTLWHAWHEQLATEGKIDLHTAYLKKLDHSLQIDPMNTRLYLVGFYQLTPPEARWATTLLQVGRATLIMHGATSQSSPDIDIHPDATMMRLATQLDTPPPQPQSADDYGRFLDQIFDYGGASLAQRTQRFAAEVASSPARERLHIFACDHSEHEARAIDLQVRLWLLEGITRIGIISEDRRLARRVRALLERAGVSLQDAAGWALSTTSAAATIERWLECVEEDFAHQSFIDFLKSPFSCPEQQRDAHLDAVYRLEQDIILHENIPRGIRRYQQHLQYRQQRLPWSSAQGDAVAQLLQRSAEAAQPLLQLHNNERRPPLEFLQALSESMQVAGCHELLAADAAGARILLQLEHMKSAAAGHTTTLDWREFRTWLGNTLETTYFRPGSGVSAVQLLNIEQSNSLHFERLIIASAEHGLLPGAGSTGPYFNEGVQRELHLPTREERINRQFYHFRRLLESAPQILITYRSAHDGEEIMPSPWVEAILSFHTHAWSTGLHPSMLASLLQNPATEVLLADTSQRPSPTTPPTPVIPASLLPATLSASTYQRLIDCPYQFFAADCIGLKPLDEIRELLEKSDYGQRVHRCLEALHDDVDKLPGPFAAPITAANREAAVASLIEISEAEFSTDLEDNFMHRGWLKRWLSLIPAYIDWQIARGEEWQPHDTECSLTHQLNDRYAIKGRLDRIDRNSNGRLAIVDYKTGHTPHQDDVEAGEAVQLPTYALLQLDAVAVEYLQLDNHKVETKAHLEGEALQQLAGDNRQRLIELLSQMENGAPLPAWGDHKTCSHCTMQGICRKQAWQHEMGTTENTG